LTQKRPWPSAINNSGVSLLVFKGIQKTTLIDFPGKVACTLFLPKCNFRCPFCYNKQLVFDKSTGVEIPEKDALQFLDKRKGFLDGICITGGEPLLHEGIVSFCKKVKDLGLLVKLDTNGSKPALLKELLEQGLLDYVAMDIKACKASYDKAAGIKVDIGAIEQSIEAIRKSSVDYEFRTTVVPSLHSEDCLLRLGNWLSGSKRLFLQQFDSEMPLLDSSLEGSKAYDNPKLQEFAKILQPFFGEVKLRGL